MTDVQLYALQKGPGSDQIAQFSKWHRIADLGSRLDEHAAFVDTAAVMKCLDLVITCDSVLAHLAGALAVPVWVLLGSQSDWRWLSGDAKSIWYPSMRLFRQKRLGDWQAPFREVIQTLGKLVKTRKGIVQAEEV
jgi:ADP-heptose:LPS heptosyltransferase